MITLGSGLLTCFIYLSDIQSIAYVTVSHKRQHDLDCVLLVGIKNPMFICSSCIVIKLGVLFIGAWRC
jgi:hypothetical protein